VDLELGRVLKGNGSITASPVGLVVGLGAQVRCASCGHGVVLGLVVSGRVEHGVGAVTARPHFHGNVVLWNQLSVESGCGVVVFGLVDDLVLEDIT